MTKHRNLLVVEDDLAVREAISRVLQTEDYRVSTAASCEDAMLRFNENHIDIVLLDLTLGTEDGWRVFEALRALRPELPIIVTSARVGDLTRSSANGASAALEKPFDVPTLLGLLEQAGQPAKLRSPSKKRLTNLSLVLALLLPLLVNAQTSQSVTPARIIDLQIQNGNAVVRWKGGGPTNQLQTASSPSGPWENVGLPTTGTSVTSVMTKPRAFYRVATQTTAQATPGQLQLAKAMVGSGSVKESLGVAADRSGNVVVVGDFQGTIDLGNGPVSSAGGFDAFVAKYNSQGALLWSKSIGAAGDDTARAISIDSQGNIIVVGSFSSSVDFGGLVLTSVPDPFGRIWSDIFVAKYTPSGSLLWAKRFGGTQPDTGDAVGVDGSDNVFVAGRLNSLTGDFGRFTLTNAGSVNVALTKISPTGTVLWAKRFGGTEINWAHGLAVDRSGDVVLTGEFWTATDLGGGTRPSAGANDIFLAKYSGTDGSYRWGKTFGGGGMDRGYGVAVDPQTGNVVITGGLGGSVDFGGGAVSGGIFLAGYDASGNYLWSQGYGTASTVDSGLAVSIDSSGTLAFGGAVYSGALDFGGGWLLGNGNADLFVASFTLTGNAAPVYRWARRAGTGMNGISQANAVALDGLGHVMIAGSFQMTVDFGGVSATGPAATSAAFAAQYSQ